MCVCVCGVCVCVCEICVGLLDGHVCERVQMSREKNMKMKVLQWVWEHILVRTTRFIGGSNKRENRLWRKTMAYGSSPSDGFLGKSNETNDNRTING